MAQEPKSPSATPIPSTETESATVKVESSSVTEAQWEAMQTVLDNINAYKIDEDHDPVRHFRRNVNKRNVPDYYDIVKEPMALSTIKAKKANQEYRSFAEFVRDLALIPHNAQVYNRPSAGAYQDALLLKSFIESELQKLVDQNIITKDVAEFPDLGEIPPASPGAEDEEEEEEEDEEDEEDEDADESDDGAKKRKRRVGRPPGSTKRDTTKDEGGQKGDEADLRKKRGRPPRVDTPMEARIKAILKGLRKIKNSSGELKIRHFERLPDKTTMPEYFAEIKVPMALDVIKRKLKRKKYQAVDHFMKDVETMFENAKAYNEDESEIYKDAVDLQIEARQLAEQEKKRPDSDFLAEDGRMPMPQGILHNGELWKVGDWVHIQNPNDLTKPIVAQIYRTWQDTQGKSWINACWYYRPEQTVHRFDRHFFENEVVKTGQYRDHQIEEVVDRCFVMFFTRYNKGRPRGFPPDKDVYVCESRYNEEKFRLNKIKTWASCVPDEVRERDYEMDLFEVPRKMKKVPSPIKHLLKEDAKETDDLPKPTWGVENAPPIVGAVHKRPRAPNESPPPEPTPTPPPQPPPPQQPARRPSHLSNPPPSAGGFNSSDTAVDSASRDSAAPAPMPTPVPPPVAQTPQPLPSQYPHHFPPQYPHHSASPAPTPPLQPSYGVQHPQQGPPTPQSPFTAPQQVGQQYNSFYNTHPNYGYSQTPGRPGMSSGSGYNPPRPVEAFHLHDPANLSIPEDIREQFHRNEFGHVLFFAQPPLDTLKPFKEGVAVGHTARYLAAKQRREETKAAKRMRDAEDRAKEDEARKKAKAEDPKIALMEQLAKLKVKAMEKLEEQMLEGTKELYQKLYGGSWKEMMQQDLNHPEAVQKAEEKRRARLAELERKTRQAHVVPLRNEGVFLDDIDPRIN